MSFRYSNRYCGFCFSRNKHARADAVKAGGDQRLVRNLVQLVAGELFGHEPVVRLVAVERVDHVVAIFPGVGAVVVVNVAGAVGIARHVEPMPPPTLAVVRRGEQAIHYLLPRVRRGIVDERLHLVGRRQQADHVEIDAADQRAAIGRRRGLESLLRRAPASETRRSDSRASGRPIPREADGGPARGKPTRSGPDR